MFRRPSWAQFSRVEIPSLFVLRPMGGGFTPPNIGDTYPPPIPSNKREVMRARQLYEQRRIGGEQELEILKRKLRNFNGASGEKTILHS